MQSPLTMPVKFLQGEKVYLRPLSLADTDQYFHQLFDHEVRRWTGTQKCFTKEQIHQYIEEKWKDSSSLLLLIALQENDEVIGDIAIQDIDSYNRNANIRIAISNENHQGKGYGKEAMTLMLNHGFGILNLHRIELNVFSYNKRALHVYKQLGFQIEGVQREALFYHHEYHDSILMSILEDEFRKTHSISTKKTS
ncbi:GNAT family N-acetyltransferase [Risungbinella massiliensis]|uniref:GNAT family N-acetyltransferase n=1 Tax=Risungbinella massiliensis TaxID=1329796 RepID=UPI0005CC36C1|nr:GNAT family protein [Risungbinella massiliensis]